MSFLNNLGYRVKDLSLQNVYSSLSCEDPTFSFSLSHIRYIVGVLFNLVGVAGYTANEQCLAAWKPPCAPVLSCLCKLCLGVNLITVWATEKLDKEHKLQHKQLFGCFKKNYDLQVENLYIFKEISIVYFYTI